VDTQNLTFSFLQGASPATKQFTISNAGGGRLSFTTTSAAANGGTWLSVSPANGIATPVSPVAVTITVNPTGWAPGTYTGMVKVSTTTASVNIPVAVTVTRPKPIPLLSQRGLTFTAVAQGGAVLPQSFGILNLGQGAMNWRASASTLAAGPNWLTTSSGSGVVPRPFLDVSFVEVSINAAGLAPGDYYGKVEVNVADADASIQTVAVILNVLPDGSNPGPVVRPTGLIFTGGLGSKPGSQTVLISNITARQVNFTSNALTYDGVNWLTHVPRNATVTPDQANRVVVQPDFTSLPAGIRYGVITMLFDDSSVRHLEILTVVAAADNTTASKGSARFANGCTANQLLPKFTSLANGFSVPLNQPTNVEVRIVDNCGNPLTSGTVKARFSNGDSELELRHTKDGSWSGTWQPLKTEGQVRISVIALAGQGNNVFGGRTDPPLTGNLRSGATVPLVAPGAVLNGASFVANAPVAPGSLITIFGSRLADEQVTATSSSLKTELGGSEVVLGGKPLPLLYASDGQLNAQLPYDLTVNSQQHLLVRRRAALSVPEFITVAAAQPAVFTQDQSGRGAGVIVKGTDNTPITPANPVRAGDTVVIYCTGLGTVSPAVPPGEAAAVNGPLSRTTNPVSVTIGDRQARVDYAGLTPGYTGLYQVNAVVPQGVPVGEAVAVVLSVAGQTSLPVTMAVR
jgi:uncharacterized protein (TIGR03437 family)